MTEQNPANGNLEWVTSYSYDVLNNLTQTNQGGQTRTFEYDAKSRLRSETTPEAGTITYDYWDFDAVKTRRDNRGVVTNYTYGDLNLLREVSYDTSGAPGVAPTATVSIDYWKASPGKGQIKTVTDGMGEERYGYDGLGRLESRERVIDDIRYETQYEYNAANQMTTMIYPSGKRVKVEHDARGRLSAMRSVDASNSVQETYLSEINYRVEGLISSQKLGDETTESFTYSDDLLQLTSQKVMTQGGATLLDLSYGYGALAGQMGSGSTAGNSGQLVSVTGTINGQNRGQTFTYDNVGRLVTATGLSSQPTEGTPWARRFDYDRYGNLTRVGDAVGGGNPLQNIMIAQPGGIATNRIASVNGTAFDYDASGNVTREGAKEYTYDAENRLVSVNVPGGESYGYDVRNHRVKKVVGGVVTHYIWEGEVIAEYERGGGSTSAAGTRYYHQDRLSSRIITDGAGNVKGTTDHLPFGEEIGFTGESEKHKFTTYERDGTGLHYAVNRHYASHLGRFNQVDPLRMGAVSMADPQSLNLYSYAGNDPVNSLDPLGLDNIPNIGLVLRMVTKAPFINYGGGAGGGGAPAPLLGNGTSDEFGGDGGGGWLEPEPQQQQNTERTAEALKDSIYGNKQLLKKINGCLRQLLGKNFSKVGVQTRANAPEVNTSLTSQEIKEKYKMSVAPVATAVGHEGKYGTIYISSELMADDHYWTIYPPHKTSSPGRSFIQNAYVHELGNEASYRASDGKTYGLFGKKGAPDEDSGYQLQICVWGLDTKPK